MMHTSHYVTACIVVVLFLLAAIAMTFFAVRGTIRVAATNPLLRRILLASIGAAILYVSMRVALSVSGFCYAQKRFLTDREMIERAVAYTLAQYPPRWRHLQAIPYSSTQEFFEKNRNCCEFTDYVPAGSAVLKAFRLSSWDKLRWGIAGYVIVRYDVPHIDEQGHVITFHEEESHPITNCGEVRSIQHIWPYN